LGPRPPSRISTHGRRGRAGRALPVCAAKEKFFFRFNKKTLAPVACPGDRAGAPRKCARGSQEREAPWPVRCKAKVLRPRTYCKEEPSSGSLPGVAQRVYSSSHPRGGCSVILGRVRPVARRKPSLATLIRRCLDSRKPVPRAAGRPAINGDVRGASRSVQPLAPPHFLPMIAPWALPRASSGARRGSRGILNPSAAGGRAPATERSVPCPPRAPHPTLGLSLRGRGPHTQPAGLRSSSGGLGLAGSAAAEAAAHCAPFSTAQPRKNAAPHLGRAAPRLRGLVGALARPQPPPALPAPPGWPGPPPPLAVAYDRPAGPSWLLAHDSCRSLFLGESPA